VRDYDLGATLTSGQAFRWEYHTGGWDGVIGSRWVRLTPLSGGICAEAASDINDWSWLTAYLETETDLGSVLATFPADEPMRRAVATCRGLRLLRQEPWECLASFILSSTKQIVQIQQIVRSVCQCFGAPVQTPPGRPHACAFPAAERLAAVSESELRACKMGFRAPYLRAAAQAVASGSLNLAKLADLDSAAARAQLERLPGVGPKIANCVLLFAYGFQDAFPVDVWVARALRELYFPSRRVKLKRLLHFSQTHFGPFSGYAQQYLFHYMRRQAGRLQSSLPENQPDAPPSQRLRR
jgi:N-glycosylase/DNA lyase